MNVKTFATIVAFTLFSSCFLSAECIINNFPKNTNKSNLVCTNFTNPGSISYNGTTNSATAFNPPTIHNGGSPWGGGGGVEQNQWQKKEGTGAWNDIAGATSNWYNPPTISVTTCYRRKAKRDCSNIWLLTLEVCITISSQPACDNFTNPGNLSYNGLTNISASYNPPNISSASSPSGGTGGQLEYQWQRKIGTAAWANVGVTTAAYNPPSINETTCYRRATRRSCATNWIVSSEICIIYTAQPTCVNFTDPGSIAYSGLINVTSNSYNPPLISSASAPSGGIGGQLQYVWQHKVGTGSWANVGIYTASFNPPAITESTCYRRVARRTCATTWVLSSPICITLNASGCANLTNPGKLTYEGQTTATAAYNPTVIRNGGSPWGGASGNPFEYNWEKNEGNGTWESLNRNKSWYNPPLISTSTCYRRAARRTCNTSWIYTSEVCIDINIGACNNYTDGGLISYYESTQVIGNSFDPKTITSTSAPSGGTGGNLQYRWRSRVDGGTWAVIPNSNTASYDPPAISENTRFRRQTRRDCQNAWIWSNNSIYFEFTQGAEKQLGISYAQYDSGIYGSALGDEGVATIAQTGAKWMTIVVTQYQYELNSTSIYPTSETPTNSELNAIIAKAKAEGLKVTLKPHIDLQSNTGLWRGNIGQNFNTAQWNTWFNSYKNFINAYADLAQAQGVDHFVVGTELVQTSSQEAKWREVISGVRGRFSGLLSYTANHSGDETLINWWDALDMIGVSGYYNLTTSNSPSVAQLKTAWQTHSNVLFNLHSQWGKPIIFNEIGYRSSDGSNKQPWCSSCAGPVDLQEQADTYRAFLEVFINESWIAGAYFWGWNTRSDRSGYCNDGFSAYDKPAENVLREFFGGSLKTISTVCDTDCVNYDNGGTIQYPRSLDVTGPSYDPVGIGNETYPKGGTGGKLTYRWRMRVGNSGAWSVIPNSNSSYYDPPAITASTNFLRQARRSCQSSWKNSNVIRFVMTNNSQKQLGISYARYYSGQYNTPEADLAVEEIAATGAEWVNFVVTQYQYDLNSTNIYSTNSTPTDSDLVSIINKAKSLGLKVSLKPHVDLQSDNSLWRGNIGTNFNEFQWNAWFKTYNDFIQHYADLATANGVDQMIIGTELRKTVVRESEWRNVVANVKSKFSGLLTYSANHGGEETSIAWWDAVDYIGISSYYNLTNINDPSVAQLKAGWAPHVQTLEHLSLTFNKPILFTEIGYRSSDGNNTHPWCHPLHSACAGEGRDLQEQADTYQAMFEVFMPKSWFAGVLAWGWDARASDSGPCNTGYSPYNKPAENVLRQYFGGSQKSINTNCSGGNRIAEVPEIQSFPNPSSGVFTVDLGGVTEEATLQIFDMMGGRVLKQVERQVSKVQVDISGYSSGSFILMVKAKGRRTLKKQMFKF